MVVGSALVPYPAISRAPRSNAAPPAPAAELDFSTIDSVQKAALLPSTNLELTNMTLGGLGATLYERVDTTATLVETIGNTTNANITYTSAVGSPTTRGEGVIGNAPVHETWSFNDQGKTIIDGTIGNSTEHVEWKYDIRGSSMDAVIGSIEIHKTGKTDPLNAAHTTWDGTILDRSTGKSTPLHEETYCEIDGDKGASGPVKRSHLQGTVGLADTQVNSSVTRFQRGIATTSDGDSKICGVPVGYTHILQMRQPERYWARTWPWPPVQV